MRPSESGNVLFLILIAVALFAALSHVVTQSSRSGGGSIEKENYNLRAAQILGYATTLRTATQRMIISGVPPEAIVLHKPGENFSACDPTITNCLFNPNAGGAVEQTIKRIPEEEEYSTLWFYVGLDENWRAYQVGTPAPEIVLTRFLKLNAAGRKMCAALNEALGIPGIPHETGAHSAEATISAAAPHNIACIQHFNDYYLFYATLYEG